MIHEMIKENEMGKETKWWSMNKKKERMEIKSAVAFRGEKISPDSMSEIDC